MIHHRGEERADKITNVPSDCSALNETYVQPTWWSRSRAPQNNTRFSYTRI